jgi:hypothetical protein
MSLLIDWKPVNVLGTVVAAQFLLLNGYSSTQSVPDKIFRCTNQRHLLLTAEKKHLTLCYSRLHLPGTSERCEFVFPNRVRVDLFLLLMFL